MGMNAPVGTMTARAYTVPTDAPEADGTYTWQKTTLVVVTVEAAAAAVWATRIARERSPSW